MEEKAKKQSTREKIGTGIGWIVGGAIGYYTQLNLLIPLGLALLSGWCVNKMIKSPFSKAMIPSFAVQLGQVLWVLLAFLLVGVQVSILLEVVLVTIVLVWLLMRPSLTPVILLSTYQILSFVGNLYQFISVSFGTTEHKALLVHLIIRILAVFLMIAGLREIRKQKNLNKIKNAK